MHWLATKFLPEAQIQAARLQAHYAAQPVANVARAILPARADDSHTSLAWDTRQRALCGESLPGLGRFGLRIADLQLVFWPAAGGERRLPLSGYGWRDAGAWVGEQAGVDPRMVLDLPYALEPHPLATTGRFDQAAHSAGLQTLAHWFGNADRALAPLAGLARGRAEVSPVLCWPHHFDIALLFTLRGGSRYVGAGFSPGDDTFATPYFYVSPYPAPLPGALPPLPLGAWHRGGFTGAVLAADALEGARASARARVFLDAAVEASFGALTRGAA